MMMMRKTGCMLLAVTLTALGLTGCASKTATMIYYPHANAANMTQTSEEHYQSIANIVAWDQKALIEDLDMFFMTDRPTRLTRWTTE